MVYIARRTRGKAAFLAPLAPCGQQKGAKRQFPPFFADFDQKTQKLHQNKPGIGIAHRFYIEKGITGVISGEVFFYRPPLAENEKREGKERGKEGKRRGGGGAAPETKAGGCKKEEK